MNKVRSALLVYLLAAISLHANPIFVRPPGEAYNTQGLIIFASLYAESVLISLLAGRKHWLRDTLIWLLVTSGTFVVFILMPFRLFNIRFSSFADIHSGAIMLLELMIVVSEALILWLLWLRSSGKSIFTACWIAAAGNAVSYGVSVVCFYYAFHS
jgi:hypothetical protein